MRRTGAGDAPEATERRLAAQRALVQALCDPACFPHEAGPVRLLETHISFVLLTGGFAYKIKKAVDLGFLDFTTLERRRFFCAEELRLNQRTAPNLYLDVVAVNGTRADPSIGGEGEALEYAVRMREFSQLAVAQAMLARGHLTPQHIDALALEVARFHRDAGIAGPEVEHGSAVVITAAAAQNFEQLRECALPAPCLPLIEALARWSGEEGARLHTSFERRKREGRVREGHGDLHLGNIVLIDGRPQLFDCIEFNPSFRWVDVINDAGFLVMDLYAAGHPRLAARLLNTYLEAGGDYDGAGMLRYYLVYRAVVRAKIALLRARQRSAPDEAAADLRMLDRYLRLADELSRPPPCFIVITHGLSGSGKTTLTQTLVETAGAVRLRSDVERKRMHGLAASARSGAAVGEGLYSAATTAAVYGRLHELAAGLLAAGQPVIVDATFTQAAEREQFRALAARAGVPFVIADVQAPEHVLRTRLQARVEDASEADTAVLDHQLRTREPLQAAELGAVVAIDSESPMAQRRDAAIWAPLLERLRRHAGHRPANK